MIISVFDKVENIEGKGENADYQHFLLFPQCFEKASFPDMSKGVIVWEWVSESWILCRFCCFLPFPKQTSVFSVIFILSSANALNLDQSKIMPFGRVETK